MITSSKPSPFTSPASLTENPELSSAVTPSKRKPVVPFRLPRLMLTAGLSVMLAVADDGPMVTMVSLGFEIRAITVSVPSSSASGMTGTVSVPVLAPGAMLI